MLDGSFRQILDLCLRFLFVPFSRFQELFDHLMLQIARFTFQLRHVLPDDRLRGVLQDLLDAAQVLPEACQRFREGLVRGVADAVLLHRQRRIQQRSSPCQTVYRLFGARDVRQHHLLDLTVKPRNRLAAGLLECSADLRVNLLDERFGLALDFFAVGVQLIFDLRLESGQRLLLHVLKLRRMLLEVLARLSGMRQNRLQPLHLLQQGIPQRGHSLFCFCCRSGRRFAHCGGVARHLILQLSHQAAGVFVQSTSRAVLGFCKCTLDGCPPARLSGFQFTRQLAGRGRLRGREGRGHLLLDLIGRRDQRLTLGGGMLFVLPRCLLKRLCRGLRLRRNLRLRLLRLRLQTCCGVLALLSCLPQCIGHAFQLLRMFIALSCALACEACRQFAGELLQLWRKPSWQFRSQRLGRCCMGRP